MLHAAIASIEAQIRAVLTAWGMDQALAATTAAIMAETDATGVDSHGIAMLPSYETLRNKGQLRIAAKPREIRRHGATALLSGEDGLGHPVAVQGMRLAVELAGSFGIGAVGVVNSHHFGAAGAYARIAAAAGMIGLVTSSARGVIMVPTGAAEPVLGTNPIAFAAPAGRHPPVLLDMATTTVAANKIRARALAGKPIPPGWVVDGQGRPITDPDRAVEIVFHAPEGGITPLGGVAEMSSHKGYGLALLAHVLGGALVGAAFAPLRNRTQRADEPNNIGHFFLALQPGCFRPAAAFAEDMERMIDVLRSSRRADPLVPVLIPGEPEEAARAQRTRQGVPIPPKLEAELRGVAGRAGVAFLLQEAAA